MSYERKDIPALIAAFKAARKVIVAGTTMSYLCHALEELERRGRSAVVVRLAKRLVAESIDFNISLGGYYGYDERYPLSSEAQRQLRVDWCDKIIADLQEYAK